MNLEALSKESTLKGIFVRKMLEKLAAAPESGKADGERALYLGLRAFEGKVRYED